LKEKSVEQPEITIQDDSVERMRKKLRMGIHSLFEAKTKIKEE
jgi:hypothetical protein